MATVNKLTAIYTQLGQARVKFALSPVTVTSFSSQKHLHIFTFKAYSHQDNEQDKDSVESM